MVVNGGGIVEKIDFEIFAKTVQKRYKSVIVITREKIGFDLSGKSKFLATGRGCSKTKDERFASKMEKMNRN